MLKIVVAENPIHTRKSNAYGFFVTEGEVLSGDVYTILSWVPYLADTMQARKFTGKKQQALIVPVFVDGESRDLIFIGLGSPQKGTIPLEFYRRAVGTLVKQTASIKASSLAFSLPQGTLFGVDEATLLTQSIITAQMAAFCFDPFFTDESKNNCRLKEITICGEQIGLIHEVKEVAAKAEIIAKAVNQARWWVDMPPTMLTPPHLAEKAEEIAKKQNLTITVFGEKEVIEMGMGGIAAVSRGSDVDCRLVIMEYKTDIANAPTVAFVGKGITFDSGGLSLKPARSMETMKDDMSGAAAVIAAMEALAQLKPKINVIGVAPLSENLPSGKATKPGDVITFYNGKTAEVKNTDAEGRLVLADALSYTVKHYKPDAIVDIATLTGACAYALGPYFCGLMSESDDLVQQLEEASQRSGDRVWRLPLHDDYKSAIKSNIADICNIGNEKIMAGAITAAHFLQHFVSDTPWAHLDIAGTAFDVPDISYLRTGATGFGVRLLIDLAMHWK